MSAQDQSETIWRDLSPLMQPKSVAIVGATQRPPSAIGREPRGNRVIRNLRNFGYPGRVVTVNPKYTEVMGCPCYPEIAAIPDPVDCVILAVPNRHVADLVESAAAAGVRAAVVFSAGFAEIGAEGAQRQHRLESFAAERNFLICGPNCYGVLNAVGKAPLFASTIPPGFLSGPVGLVSQSGGLSTTIANALMLNRGVGLSHIVSCGNQAGVTVEEYLNYFIDDDHTQVAAAFVEGFKQPEKLFPLARKALAKNKPLIVLKGGRSEVSRRAAITHSGSLAGAAEVIEAVFRQLGVVQVRSLNELIDTISLFSCPGFLHRYRGGRRVGVISGSGGECTIVADALDSAGLDVPQLADATRQQLRGIMADFGNANNPLDGTGAMYDDEKIFPGLLNALVLDPNIDLVTVNLEANDPRPKELKSGNRFAAAIEKAAAESPKPIAIFTSIAGGPIDPEILNPLRAAGVPLMEGADYATAALQHLARYYEFNKASNAVRYELLAARPSSSGSNTAGIIPLVNRICGQARPGILPATDAFHLLESFGISVAPLGLARTAEEAAEIALGLGFPVALKVDSPQIMHKSDIGGVVLSVANAAHARDAFHRIHDQVRAKMPSADIAGVIVQRMAPPGVEMILGIQRDPMFGPVIVCGIGGVFVEILDDVAIGIPPLSRSQAEELVKQLRGWPLLAGVRGKPTADVAALCNAILGLSQLALNLRDKIEAVDVNPLIVQPNNQGVIAVDALVEIR
jgi:acyl-CoA synthetase (NDP forming)